MRLALDSNVLVYAAGVIRDPAEEAKVQVARTTLNSLRARSTIVVPTQVVGEVFSVIRKVGGDDQHARRTVLDLIETGTVVSAPQHAFVAALDLAVDHNLQFWDALILSTAADAGCAVLLSEDMQDGFVWRGITVADPFAAKPQPALRKLLAG